MLCLFFLDGRPITVDSCPLGHPLLRINGGSEISKCKTDHNLNEFIFIPLREFSFCIRLSNSVTDKSGIIGLRAMNRGKGVVNPYIINGYGKIISPLLNYIAHFIPFSILFNDSIWIVRMAIV